jgi:HlyD family secretion protein
MIENSSSMDRTVAAPKGLTRNRAVLLGGTIALAILAAVLFPSIRRWSNADRSVDATTMSIAAVTRGDLRRDVSVQGRVVAALHPTLVAPAQGTVSMTAKAGQVVRRGEILAVIDSPEVRSALEQAKAQLLSLQSDTEREKIAGRQSAARLRQEADIARTRLEAAKRALVRAETLHKEGLLNRGDFEHAQDELHLAELEVAQATREIALSEESSSFNVRARSLQVERQQSVAAELQKRFDDLTIRAPFDGMIAALPVNDRDSVVANAPVISIVNLSSLELELQIPEDYAADVQIGTPVSITYGAEEQQGHVTAVSPEVTGNQITARAVPDRGWDAFGRGGMKQNQRVTTRLVFESKHNVLKVPRGAFLESGGGRRAYVVEGNSATRRDIEAGAVSVSEIEIVSGLREGERIVVSDTSTFGNARTIILH